MQVTETLSEGLKREFKVVVGASVDESSTTLAAQSNLLELKDGAEERGRPLTISLVGKKERKPFDRRTNEEMPPDIGTTLFIPHFEDKPLVTTAGSQHTTNAV